MSSRARIDAPALLGVADLDELFELYRSTGFLYPEKEKAIEPVWQEIRGTWCRALSSANELLWIVAHRDQDGTLKASECNWRHAMNHWFAQHLVSRNGSAFHALTAAIRHYQTISSEWYQAWYRGANPFPQRVFSGMAVSAGHQSAATRTVDYYSVPCSVSGICGDPVRRCSTKDVGMVLECLRKWHGRSSTHADALDEHDPFLDEVNKLYARAGLFLRRCFWIARSRRGQPIGIAVVNRASLGLNFSFLENRCELALSPEIPESQRHELAASLIAHAAHEYEDFALSSFPCVMANAPRLLHSAVNATFHRSYNQTIVRREGFPAVEEFFIVCQAERDKRRSSEPVEGAVGNASTAVSSG